jgi:nucleotide-binding universal stress UspA family protein
MKYAPQVTKILYATDMGSETRPIFRYAIDMANHYKAEIIMLHVVEPISDTARAVISTYLDNSISEEMEKNSLKGVLDKMKDRLKKFYREECDSDEKFAVLIKEVKVVAGRPSEEILRIAEEEKTDMIVMGKSARKVRGIGVMGSSARRVSRLAKIPVLVIPTL